MSMPSRTTLKPGEPGKTRRRLHLREIVDAGPQEAQTVGSELRAARARAGLDLREIADALRIRYRHLEALECGYHSELPGKTYAVGFVRAYGEYLGLNPDDLVRRFKAEVGDVTMAAAAPTAAHAAELSFGETGDGLKLPTGTSLVLVLALLIGSGATWYLSRSPDVRLASEVPPAPQFVEPDARLLRPHPSVPNMRDDKREPLAVELTATKSIAESDPETAPDETAESGVPASDSEMAAAGGGDDGELRTRLASVPARSGNPERVAEPEAQFGPPPPPAASGRSSIVTVDEAPRTPAPSADPVVLASADQLTQAFGGRAPFSEDMGPAPVSVEALAERQADIQILALSSSWLRIDDGEGKVLIQRRLREGEIFAVPNRDGLIMAARNAGAFQIMIDGRPVGRAGDDGEVLSGLPLNPDSLRTTLPSPDGE